MRTALLLSTLGLSLCFCVSIPAQKLQHPTQVSAGGSGVIQSHTLQGSLGQALVGRVRTPETIQGVGFWYRPQPGAGVTIAVPYTEGEIGTRVKIPVMLTHSSKMGVNSPRVFIIKLRYNKTVLVYKGLFAVVSVGADNVITISGTTDGTNGIIAELEFLVTLGNAERTDINIDEVTWEGAAIVVTERVHGSFQALGLCKENDVVRLIHRKSTTAIESIAPQPAAHTINVDVLLGADGAMSMHVIDLSGSNVGTLIYQTNAKAGLQHLSFDVSHLITGSYYIVLQTPDQLHTASLIIRK